jgi:hypothetical protein
MEIFSYFEKVQVSLHKTCNRLGEERRLLYPKILRMKLIKSEGSREVIEYRSAVIHQLVAHQSLAPSKIESPSTPWHSFEGH